MVILINVVQQVVDVDIFLGVEVCTLDQFYGSDDSVVIPRLIKYGEGLNLASCHLATLSAPEVICGLHLVLRIGELVHIFAGLVFEYFCVHQNL